MGRGRGRIVDETGYIVMLRKILVGDFYIENDDSEVGRTCHVFSR